MDAWRINKWYGKDEMFNGLHNEKDLNVAVAKEFGLEKLDFVMLNEYSLPEFGVTKWLTDGHFQLDIHIFNVSESGTHRDMTGLANDLFLCMGGDGRYGNVDSGVIWHCEQK